MPGSITSLAFSLDGAILAGGGLNGNIRLWNVNTGEHKTTLIGHVSRGEKSLVQFLMKKSSPAQVQTAPSVCGIQTLVNTRRHSLGIKGPFGACCSVRMAKSSQRKVEVHA